VRMTFERMPDRRPVETLVERDDGVVFEMRGPGGGADLPHDLVHALVERELRVADGVWGCVADGVVWGSMRHVSGRQPPHAAERSARLKRERAAAVQRAEGLADVGGRLARGEEGLPGQVTAAGVPPERLRPAAEAVRGSAARWGELRPGETWVLDWPPRAGTAVRAVERWGSGHPPGLTCLPRSRSSSSASYAPGVASWGSTSPALLCSGVVGVRVRLPAWGSGVPPGSGCVMRGAYPPDPVGHPGDTSP